MTLEVAAIDADVKEATAVLDSLALPLGDDTTLREALLVGDIAALEDNVGARDPELLGEAAGDNEPAVEALLDGVVLDVETDDAETVAAPDAADDTVTLTLVDGAILRDALLERERVPLAVAVETALALTLDVGKMLAVRLDARDTVRLADAVDAGDEDVLEVADVVAKTLLVAASDIKALDDADADEDTL